MLVHTKTVHSEDFVLMKFCGTIQCYFDLLVLSLFQAWIDDAKIVTKYGNLIILHHSANKNSNGR